RAAAQEHPRDGAAAGVVELLAGRRRARVLQLQDVWLERGQAARPLHHELAEAVAARPLLALAPVDDRLDDQRQAGLAAGGDGGAHDPLLALGPACHAGPGRTVALP